MHRIKQPLKHLLMDPHIAEQITSDNRLDGREAVDDYFSNWQLDDVAPTLFISFKAAGARGGHTCAAALARFGRSEWRSHLGVSITQKFAQQYINELMATGASVYAVAFDTCRHRHIFGRVMEPHELMKGDIVHIRGENYALVDHGDSNSMIELSDGRTYSLWNVPVVRLPRWLTGAVHETTLVSRLVVPSSDIRHLKPKSRRGMKNTMFHPLSNILVGGWGQVEETKTYTVNV